MYYHIYSYKVLVKSQEASVDRSSSTWKNYTFIVLSCIYVHVHKVLDLKLVNVVS